LLAGVITAAYFATAIASARPLEGMMPKDDADGHTAYGEG